MSTDVAGYCPMGCGQTLFLGAGGRITCRRVDCANPVAVDVILDDPETEHVVELGEKTFIVRHPLRERVEDALLVCDLHSAIASMPRAPQRLGRYRVTADGVGGWDWEQFQ